MTSSDHAKSENTLEIFYPIDPPKFNYVPTVEWMSNNYQLSFGIVLAYLALCHFGPKFMAHRTPLNLRWQLFGWNLLLSLFSILGTSHTLVEMIKLLWNNGLYDSICDSCSSVSPSSAYFAWLFVLSKVVELGDTAFIVLRKRKLIFLHWYHHCTVLLYTWYSYSEYIAPARWFVVMNYTIHSIMYTYYAVKSLHFRIPRGVPLAITTLQLSQMVVGIVINIYAYLIKLQNIECNVSKQNLEISFLIYGSYALLFWHYFRNSYLTDKGNKQD